MIQNYEEKYDKQIKKLLQESSYFLPCGNASKETLLVIENRAVVAIGSLWKNQVHPYNDYVGIYVSPHHRRRGIGSLLFEELAKHSHRRNFQAAALSTDKAAVRFLNELGFTLARKSYETALSPVDFAESEEETVRYKDLDPVKKNELMQLHLHNYKDTHRDINPLNEELALNEWEKLTVADLEPNHSFVSIKNQKVVAYILCYKGSHENEIEIGYIGGKEESDIETYLSFYKVGLLNLFNHYEEVWIEADDVDPYAFAVLNLFEYDSKKSYDTYIL